jgi:hypothetical protein
MKVLVIIPCYNVRNSITPVLKKSLKLFDKIVCVDDNCPQNTFNLIKSKFTNKKIAIHKLKKNLGVGGATKFAIKKYYKNFDIICKIDGDNQFNPNECSKIIKIFSNDNFDYAKGNRFLNKKNKKNSPIIRWGLNKIIGFLNKFTTGNIYLNDPLNGFFAFKKNILNKISLNNISNDFFFETDLLFNCSLKKIRIKEYPIKIRYFKQNSNFRPVKEIINFSIKHFIRFFYRIWLQNFKDSINFISLFIVLFLLIFIINFGYNENNNYSLFIFLILFLITLDFIKNSQK